jgi:hypothetical protein
MVFVTFLEQDCMRLIAEQPGLGKQLVLLQLAQDSILFGMAARIRIRITDDRDFQIWKLAVQMAQGLQCVGKSLLLSKRPRQQHP